MRLPNPILFFPQLHQAVRKVNQINLVQNSFLITKEQAMGWKHSLTCPTIETRAEQPKRQDVSTCQMVGKEGAQCQSAH